MMKRVCLCLLAGLLLVACSSSEEKSIEYTQRAVAYLEQGRVAEAKVEAKNAIKLNPKAARAHLVLGDCATKEQNWRGAFAGYSRAAQLNPDLLKAHLGMGKILLLSRQHEEADKVISLVLEKDPENVDAHLLKAGLLLQLEDYDGAQRILAAILAKHPDNTDATLGLVTVFERKGEIQLAQDALNKALLDFPDNAVLHYKAATIAENEKQYAVAERHYLRLLDLSENKAPIQMMIARLYERSGELEKAEDMLNNLLADEPGNLDYRLGLVSYLLRHKKYDKALSGLDSAPAEIADDVRLDVARADVLLAKGDVEAAKGILRGIGDEHSDHPLAGKSLAKLGGLYMAQKDFESALSVLEEAITLDPSPNILFMRAQARLGVGNVEGAIADLRIVRKELPDNYKARQLLARAYLSQDKGLMAVEELHDILERNADYSPSRSLLVQYYARYGQWNLAEEELKKLLAQTPDDPALLLALGDVKRKRDDYQAAKDYYASVLDLDKGHGPALLRLGLLAEMQKDYNGAVEYYDKVLALHPKSAAAIERKLFALLAGNRTAEVRSYQRQLAQDLPESPVLHDIFGRLALVQKDTETAETEFRKASQLAPEWSVPYQRLIGIYLRENKTDKVVAECKTALEKNPDAYVEEFLLGQIYQLEGDNDKAQTAYESVLKKKPGFLPAANNLAYLYAETADGDTETLERALELAQLAAKKDNAEALDTLGWIYHLMGNREQSIEILGKAYEKVPDNKVVAFHLATVLAKWAYHEEARRIIDTALADKRDFPERKEFERLRDSL